MIAVPPGSEPRLPLFRTVAAHFENTDGEPVAGVRVVEPSFDSRPSLRGNLYAVVDLVGANPDRLMQAERLLGAIQRTYYAHPGSQSQVLTEAVRQARNKIDELNRALVPDRGHEPWRPGIVCASLVNGRLMVIHNGPAMALVTAGNRVERYPTELSSFGDPDLLTRPISWEIYRQDVDTNVGLFIGTARWLDALDSRVIAGTVAHLTAENCRAAATGLSMEAMPYELPGVLLYAERTSLVPKVPPILQNRVPTPPTPGPSATGVSADERRPRATAGALPSSVHAKPPLRDIPAADQDDDAAPSRTSVAGRDPHTERSNEPPWDAADAAGQWRPDGDDIADYAPPVTQTDYREEPQYGGAEMGLAPDGLAPDGLAPDDRALDDIDLDDEWLAPETDSAPVVRAHGAVGPGDTYPAYQADSPATPHAGAQVGAMLAHIGTATKSGLVRVRELFTGMLPEATGEEPSHNPYRATGSTSGAGASSSAEATAAPVYAEMGTRMQDVLRDTGAPYRPPAPTRGGRARLFVLLAILLLVLIPVIVQAVVWTGGNTDGDPAQGYVDMADTRLKNGLAALDSDDDAMARVMCSEARENLDQAVAVLGNTERIRSLSSEVQRCLDAAMFTKYLYELAEPLVRFPADAEPHRILVADENIYVLDTGRQRIDIYQLDGTRQYLPDPTPDLALFEGQVVDGVTVGRLVDMGWQDVIAGFQEKASLLVLDRNNQLFQHNQRVEGAAHINLGADNPLQIPNQIEIYLGRTYLADEGANEIFRYNIGEFQGMPDLWFDDQVVTNLSGLLTMAIDGEIWLLYNNGNVVRYSQGVQQPFSLDSGAVLADQPVDMAIGDLASPYLYIADAAHSRILVFNKSDGAYVYQLLAPEGDPLQDLRGIFVDPIDGNFYILTKSALYQHPIPD